ncbi:FecR family protein [Chitinophaga jiangningensis]|uniref:FecR family protein n=1 Tax=Chitinophaga jiangningensis TaxID=1419482 RepID=A0A1M7C4B4_9BACT|nr:FecR family protein [Chitinophaga jiangningensis]SHL62142.1 FecR family protein [Chitinophaga jiangningensis]
MEKERLRYLFQQYQRHSQSPAEQEEWLAALSDANLEPLLHEIAAEEWEHTTPATEALSAEEAQQVYEAVISHPQPARVRRLWPRMAIAASFLSCLLVAGYLYYKSKPIPAATIALQQPDVVPGATRATLTLANGRKIVLSAETDGAIAKQAGIQIKKERNGVLVYEVTDSRDVAANAVNTLSTAKGETYKIILPDRTQVWLNASSSLTYPVKFNGADRAVTLSGEGYFEVAGDPSHPFKVNAGTQQVTVLGTHFNINAYTNEQVIRTTLLEGSVKVSAGNAVAIIQPGQQSTLQNGDIGVRTVDTDQATAWKDDQFVFDGENIQYIMRMIERWYDVDVVYEGAVSREKFYGGISRYENVSEILKVLESTKSISFRIAGKTIYVKTKETKIHLK